MTRDELRERLSAEVAVWAGKTYRELAALTFPVIYDTGDPTAPYQTEVTLLEKTPAFIHLALAVSDRGMSVFIPVSDDVVVRADGETRP